MTQPLVLILVSILIVSLIVVLIISGYRDGYRAGQIAALSGNQEYKLVEFKDGTRSYYKESELKDLIEHKIINTPPLPPKD